MMLTVAVVLYARWLLYLHVDVHSATANVVAATLVFAGFLVAGKYLGGLRVAPVVLALLVVAFLVFHSAATPWGYEYLRVIEDLPLPEGGDKVGSEHHSFPICGFGICMHGSTGYAYPSPPFTYTDLYNETLIALSEKDWQFTRTSCLPPEAGRCVISAEFYGPPGSKVQSLQEVLVQIRIVFYGDVYAYDGRLQFQEGSVPVTVTMFDHRQGLFSR